MHHYKPLSLKNAIDDFPNSLLRGSLLLLKIARLRTTAVRAGSHFAACADALSAAGHVRIIRFRGEQLHLIEARGTR